MKLVHTINEVWQQAADAKRAGKMVGLVPTMGALHEGHISLIKRARQECGFVVVSIFVNPAQFGANEDLDTYPRTLNSDSQKCERAGADLLFAPSAAEMYPKGFDTWVNVNGPTEMLEGARRPGHFRGVTTVCAKLFGIALADVAYFGQKDYQQLTVIQKMVRDLNIPLLIVPVETVREADGLAMSSRNVYLSSAERQAALVLSRSLKNAESSFESGERRVQMLQQIAGRVIEAEPLARIDYVEIVDAETLDRIETIERPAVLLLAVKIGATRLIDNLVIGEEFF